MPVFGRYQTVSEIDSSGSMTLWSARLDGAPTETPRFAIKSLSKMDVLAEADVIEARTASFLRVAKLLESLSKSAPGKFIKIHEVGQTDDVAYYIADLAPMALQLLVDTKRDLATKDLVRVIRSVTDAIAAMRESGVTKVHGNLKPSNILLTNTDISQASVVLTDPVDPQRIDDEQEAASDDLKSIGALLFELVAHRSAPSGTEIRKGPEWDRLGGPGESLRQLCEQLINPTAGQELTLADISARLDAALLVKDKFKFPIVPAALVAVLVLGAGGFFAYKTIFPPPPAPAPVPMEETVRDLRTDEFKANTKQILDAYAADLTTGEIAKRFNAIGSDGVKARQTLEEANKKLRAEVDALIAIEGDTNAKRSEINSKIPALEASLAAFRTTIDRELDSMEFAKASTEFEALAAEIEEKTIKGILEKAKKIQDPAELQKGTESANAIAAKLTQARTTIEEARKKLQPPSQPSPADPAATPAPATEPAPATQPDKYTPLAPIVAQASTVFDEIKAQSRQWQQEFDKEGAALALRIEQEFNAHETSAGKTASLLDRPMRKFLEWAKEDFIQDTKATQAEYLTRKANVEAWTAAAKSLDAVSLTAKPSSLFPQEQLQNLSKARRELALLPIVTEYARSRKNAGEFSLLLPADPKVGLVDVRAALEGWMKASSTLIDTATMLQNGIDNGYAPTEPIASAGKTILALRDAIKQDAQLKDFEVLANPTGDSVVKEQIDAAPVFKAALQTLSTLIASADSLDALANANAVPAFKDILAQESKAGANPNVSRAITAWNGLLKLNFPANPSDFEDLVAIKRAIEPLAAKAPDPARQQQIVKTINDSFQAAWFTLVNQRLEGTHASISRAFSPANKQSLGLTDEQITQRLSPGARANMMRQAFIEELKAAGNIDKDDLARRSNTFFNAVSALPNFDSVQSKPEWKALFDRFATARAGKGFPGANEAGPAKQGWTYVEVDPDGLRAKYTSSKVKPGRRAATELEFVKITPLSSDDASYYISTTEVSIAAFIDILEHAGDKPSKDNANAAVTRLLAAYYDDPGKDNRDGPRTWGWSIDRSLMASRPRGRNDANNDTKGWFKDVSGLERIKPFYQNPAVALQPEIDLPMNYVSAQAAVYVTSLAGCRLPTPDEFKAVADINAPQTNRRDASWAAHLAYLKNQFVAQQIVPASQNILLPYAGILRPESDTGEMNESAVLNSDDGFLWFAPVTKGSSTAVSGGTVYNLIGNVAEFVCTDRNAVTGKLSPADANNLIASKIEAVGVIGASALSPPNYEPFQVLQRDWTTASSRDGFSDVGFRLAFTAEGGGGGAGGPVASAIRYLEQLPYFGPQP